MRTYAFEVYECQKNPETHIFTVSQTATRKYDQKKLSFMVDEGGLPRTCFEPESSDEIEGKRESYFPKLNSLYAGDEDGLNLQLLMSDALGEGELSAYELRRSMQALANIQSSSFANRMIDRAENMCLIHSHQYNGVTYYKRKASDQLF